MQTRRLLEQAPALQNTIRGAFTAQSQDRGCLLVIIILSAELYASGNTTYSLAACPGLLLGHRGSSFSCSWPLAAFSIGRGCVGSFWTKHKRPVSTAVSKDYVNRHTVRAAPHQAPAGRPIEHPACCIPNPRHRRWMLDKREMR